MMRLRGASMTRLPAQAPPPAPGEVWPLLIGLGYAVRSVQQALAMRDRQLAREHWAYALGAFTGRAFVGGRLVTTRT